MDADVIKTYVRLGMGVGIVSQMAVSSGPGDSLMVLPGSNRFFQPSVTKIATLKGSLLRNYAYQLMEMLAPHLDAAVLAGAKRRPSQERAAPLLSFADRADLQAQRLSA
jgi:hypothetical protein